MSPDRVYPIVALSCKYQRADPPMSVARAREVVWPTAPIYIIESREAKVLDGMLSGLGAYNGAVRIWWPGVDAGAEARWHPLIYDSTGEYGEDAIQRLAEVFTHRPPDAVSDLTEEQRTALSLATVPRPGQAAAKCAAEVIPLTTRKDLRWLTSDLRSDRSYPVVVLTLDEGIDGPAFPLSELTDRIDPNTPIYILGTDDLCRRLANSLGGPMAVHKGNARIYWPGARESADPNEHPLVPAQGGDGIPAVDRLVSTLELSRPGVREHVTALEQALERRLQQHRGQSGDASRHLREVREENRALRQRVEAAERGRDMANRKLAALLDAGIDSDELEMIATLDFDGQLHRLIAREWINALPGAEDRASHPLRYMFGPDFTRSVSELSGTPLQRIAWVAAMIGCGRASTLLGIDPHQLRQNSAGSSRQLARTRDGAKAWRGKLNGEGASRVHYWQRADGLVEFASVAVHDVIGSLT